MADLGNEALMMIAEHLPSTIANVLLVGLIFWCYRIDRAVLIMKEQMAMIREAVVPAHPRAVRR